MAKTEFYLEFDLLDGHSPATGATLRESALKPTGWRSIGNPHGARIVNKTGKTIRAISMKSNSEKNVFRVDINSLGHLFDVAWFKADGSEVIFAEANVPSSDPKLSDIPPGTAFWNRVPPSTRDEISECDNGNACPFIGQAFDTNPTIPDDPEWTEIRRVLPPKGELWSALWDTTPSKYRDIKMYSHNTESDQILFISQNQIFLYKHHTNTLENVTEGSFPNAINSITTSGDHFYLWNNGQQIRIIGRKKKAFADKVVTAN